MSELAAQARDESTRIEKIERLRRRMEGWALNDDPAWIKVKLGELRAVFAELDHKRPIH